MCLSCQQSTQDLALILDFDFEQSHWTLPPICFPAAEDLSGVGYPSIESFGEAGLTLTGYKKQDHTLYTFAQELLTQKCFYMCEVWRWQQKLCFIWIVQSHKNSC